MASDSNAFRAVLLPDLLNIRIVTLQYSNQSSTKLWKIYQCKGIKDSLNNHNTTTRHHQDSHRAAQGYAELLQTSSPLQKSPFLSSRDICCLWKVVVCTTTNANQQLLVILTLKMQSTNSQFKFYSDISQCNADITASNNNSCLPLGHTDYYNFYQLGLPSLSTRGHSGSNKRTTCHCNTARDLLSMSQIQHKACPD